jgi:hypothetical protein
VYEKVIESFWCTAYYDEEEKKICARVGNVDVEISEADVRRVLEFGDNPNDPSHPMKEKVRMCLIKCGYPDPQKMIKKSMFCAPFRYLAHVLMMCLSNRKHGTDSMNEEVSKVFASLIMNMPFNISRMIWNYMVVSARSKNLEFLMYPRFIQMILDDKFPDLPKDGNLMAIYKMGVKTLGHMQGGQGDRPKDVEFWGAILDHDYVCPPDDVILEELRAAGYDVELQEPSASTTGKRRRAAESDRRTEDTLQHMDAGARRRHPRIRKRPSGDSQGRPSDDTQGRPSAEAGPSNVNPQVLNQILTRVGNLEIESAANKIEIADLKRRLTRERRKRKDEQKKNFDYRKKLRNMDRLLTMRKLEIEALADGENIKDIEAVDPAEHSDPEPDTESETEQRGTDPVA